MPPGILKTNAIYKYHVRAITDHMYFEWDNISTSNNDSTRFMTGPTEATQPHIDLRNIGVETWNDLPPLGAYTLFYVRIHDAQGVPGDIETARVILPDSLGAVNLYLEEQLTENSGLYRGVYFGATPAGEYTFEAIDRSGNPGSATEVLDPNIIDRPAVEHLEPIEGSLVGGTGLDFNWDDVTGAAFYQLNIYDENFNRIYNIKTIASEFKFPPGLLEENRLYRYRIYTRREFYEENADNTSSSPP